MANFKASFKPESPILFTAEHASGRIPSAYKQLGLSRYELENSEGDVYDYGTKELTLYLAKKLNSSYLWSNISRVVIDHNRLLRGSNNESNSHHSSALKTKLPVEYEDGTDKLVDIPGNMVEDPESEETFRYMKYVAPYQLKGLQMAYELKMTHQPTYIIQIHSFHHLYNGEKRTTDIDVLDGKGSVGSTKMAKELVRALSHQTDYQVDLNKPWGMDAVSGGVFDSVLRDRGMRLLAFDINNKFMRTNGSIRTIGDHLVRAIHQVIL